MTPTSTRISHPLRRPGRVILAALALSVVGALAGTSAAAVDNGRIVYEGFDPETGKSDIYTMNAHGSDVRRLTSDGAQKGHPEWSPDGTRIAFEAVGYESGNCCSRNIYAINADGTDKQRLTEIPSTDIGENFDATWAPDGSWLAFVSTRGQPGGGAGDRELYRMNADGSEETPLTDTDARTSDEQPSVSPDGTRIAFASDRANSGNDSLMDIYTMDADGSSITRLTFDGGYRYPLPSRSTAPAWSPDGSRIAFESTRNGNAEIWVMDADGSDAVNVSDHPGADTEPAWSPDGTQITFTSSRAGQEDIWAVEAPAPNSEATAMVAPIGPATATAAGAPQNLTPGDGRDARSPDWAAAIRTPVAGGGDACTQTGTSGADVLVGTAGADVLCGLGGNDTLKGVGGNDTLKGMGGADVLRGGAGHDLLEGRDGKDTLIGEAGADRLVGADQADTLRSRDGIAGNDTVEGGAGTDSAQTDPTEASIVGVP